MPEDREEKIIANLVEVEAFENIPSVIKWWWPFDVAALLDRIVETAKRRRAEGRHAEAAFLEYLRPHIIAAVPDTTGDPHVTTIESLLGRVAQLPNQFDRYLLLRRHRELLRPSIVGYARSEWLAADSDAEKDRWAAVYALLAVLCGDDESRFEGRLFWMTILRKRGAARAALRHADLLIRQVGSGDHQRIGYLHGARQAILASIGEYEKALAAAELSLTHLILAGATEPEQATVRKLLAEHHAALGHIDEALRELDTALALWAAAPGTETYRIDALRTRNSIYAKLSEYDLAVADLRAVVDLAELVHAKRPAMIASADLTFALIAAGRHREAVQNASRLLTSARGSKNSVYIAAALNNLAYALKAAGDHPAAEQAFRDALQLAAGQEGGTYNEMHSKFGIGDILNARGDTEGAEALWLAGLVDGLWMGRAVDALTMFTTRASGRSRIYREGRIDIEGMLRDALEQSRQAADQQAEALIAVALAQRLAQRGEVAEANSLCRAQLTRIPQGPMGLRARTEIADLLSKGSDTQMEAYDLLWAVRNDLLAIVERAYDPAVRAELIADHFAVYDGLIELLLDNDAPIRLPEGRSRYELAFDLHEEAKSRTMLARMAEAPLPAPAGLSLDLLERESSLLAEKATGRHDTAHAREIRTRLAAVWSDMAATAPEYVRLRRGIPLRLGEVRDILRRHAPLSGMTLASYFCGKRSTACFLLTADGRLDVTTTEVSVDHLQRVADKLHKTFNGASDIFPPLPPIRARNPFRRNLDFLARLGPGLVGFAAGLPQSSLVCVAPHGPLHLLPLHALPMRPDDSNPMATRVATSYCPSISVMAHLLARASTPATGTTRAVVIGVAAKEDPDPELFESIADLPHSGQATVTEVLGTRATKAAVLDALRDADTAYITCHGYANPHDPLSSGVVVVPQSRTDRPTKYIGRLSVLERAGTLLRAADLTAARLTLRLVVLRGCSTGWHSGSNAADEFTGLTRAFLYSGTDSVIASLWNVDQHSSGLIVSQLHNRRTMYPDEPLWLAFWHAQKCLLRDPDQPWLTHPYHWAAFALIGDWR